ncbi:MAG TPA: hypothetical protein ENJ82_15045 [Bacteroidetes bacterium]|nr:hypothetical protein [Bacteroidota bacterium]
MKNEVPPRLHILSRPGLGHGLIVRRGPGKRVGFFGFDFAKQVVTEGQWLKGRIYERRCDLSEDGKYIIYFAANHKPYNVTGGSWTAVSRFPYLKALDLWGKGDSYNGGGLFLSADEYLLNEKFPHKEIQKTSPFKVSRGKVACKIGNNECLGVYFPKLMRDGWQHIDKEGSSQIFQKNYKNWRIRKRCDFGLENPIGVGSYFDENMLINQASEVVLNPKPDNWMDFKQNKVWWTEEGLIKCANLEGERISQVTIAADMRAYSYRRILAPYNK